MIRANASRCPVSAQCRMPGVPRSVCCWMIEHPEAGRVDPIAGDVHAVRRDGHERCGAGKIKAVLECLCSMVLRPVERLVFSPKER